MKKLRLVEDNSLTLEEGCNKYLDNCRARNLREGTINHYRQSYVQFAKFFDMNMPIMEMDEKLYQKYVVFLRETLHNDVSINSYLRDFITTMHFLMNEGYLPHFKMQAIKVDRSGVETYSEEELMALANLYHYIIGVLFLYLKIFNLTSIAGGYFSLKLQNKTVPNPERSFILIRANDLPCRIPLFLQSRSDRFSLQSAHKPDYPCPQIQY